MSKALFRTGLAIIAAIANTPVCAQSDNPYHEQTTGQLLSECDTDWSSCLDFFDTVLMAVDDRVCIPAALLGRQTDVDSNAPSDEAGHRIVEWLKVHRELADKPSPDTVGEAMVALWPC